MQTENNFNYPTIYNFPPFFTRQRHEGTWIKQCEQWSLLILDYFQAMRRFEIDLSNSEIYQKAPFYNSTIQRALSKETLQAIVKYMIAKGQACYPNPENSHRVLFLWKSIEEWTTILYSHIQSIGAIGSIMTIYELFYSGEAEHCDFYSIPESMWRVIIGRLEEQGKARIFDSNSSNSMELGIKFF